MIRAKKVFFHVSSSDMNHLIACHRKSALASRFKPFVDGCVKQSVSDVYIGDPEGAEYEKEQKSVS